MRHTSRALLLLVILSTLFAACGSTTTTTTAKPTTVATAPAFGKPSTSFQLTGLVQHTATFTLATLQALPKVTVTTTTTPLGQHTFGGALLYSLLQQGGIVTNSTRKNDILRKLALISGTDGYSVAISMGEILPTFANKQIIVAYEEDSKPLPQADGFARLIVPGDMFAGRYISNVAQIDVRSPGPLPKLGTATPTSAFYLLGLVTNPAKYDLTALKALKATTVTIQSQDQSGKTVTTTYSGVLLNDLLQQAIVQVKKTKNDILRKGIVVVGSDGYSALVVGGEIDPKFGNVQALIAFEQNGQPLPQADGYARLIIPGDQHLGRFVSNLRELQVVELAA